MTKSWPIVGAGALSSVGDTADEMFESLCAGRSGRAPLRGFTAEWYTAGHLFERDDREQGADRPLRATEFLVEAIAQALRDAGLPEDLRDVPVLVGTGLRELRSVELWHRDQAPLTAGDLHFGTALRERFGATDTHTVANACSASLYALSMATDLLAAGAADTVVVAGTDSITESMFGIADRVQSVPPDTIRPFDAERAGSILGEGAAAVVLRREPAPDDRVLGWVRGVGINCDAGHPTAPSLERISDAMNEAHRRAGTEPDDMDLVMLHGTGTHANDLTEAQAMRAVFGPAVKVPLMTGLKSLTGHTSGTSGLHSLIVALRSMATSQVVPIATLRNPIDEVGEFRMVRGEAPVSEPVALAQINAFGFGGVNAVAVVESPATNAERRERALRA
ncbi:beta-ketoacyl synthase N-terminal-like domain-containing protein [Streptomyces profundus]|uniref:beta-ketoacyl synthase N-terminal-like domain-containing protein n=1 Tax=Streptomyces profundus TaxID=2867410 RepID=UPI001D168C12|nr:beta-ketoacyl synthase N-terminal-like domain-containing protein [Streptomyces sp. MA3_2.13]UED85088.1 3-oxoacyl-ACP synthase [Streptomyces sp. MA3_2.13]